MLPIHVFNLMCVHDIGLYMTVKYGHAVILLDVV